VRYFVRTVIGFALFVAGLVAISYAVYQLLQVGTCASGGPYQVARECPDGIERLMLGIPGGLFAILIGGGIYSTRGRAPGSDRDPDVGRIAAIGWAGLFLGIAFACFWGVWGPDANPGPGAKTGGLIVGFTFVPMGLLGAIPMLSAGKAMGAAKQATGIGIGDALKMARQMGGGDMSELVRRLQEQAAQGGTVAVGAGGKPGESVVTGGGDVVTKLERLQALRSSGAIDAAEFERLKAQVMGGA
jgi:Short C-terminal domain